MRLLAPCFVTGGGFLCTMIVMGGGGGGGWNFSPFESCSRGMVNDEIDSPIHDGFISFDVMTDSPSVFIQCCCI